MNSAIPEGEIPFRSVLRVHGRELEMIREYSNSGKLTHRVLHTKDLNSGDEILVKQFRDYRNPELTRRAIGRIQRAFALRQQFASTLDGRVQKGLTETLGEDGTALYKFVPGKCVLSKFLLKRELAPLEARLAYISVNARTLLETSDRLADSNLGHRDVKPANIVGNVLIDIDTLADLDEANRVEEGRLVGTPWIIAPEVVAKVGWDLKTDKYSLGMTFATLIYPPSLERQIEHKESLNEPPVPILETEYGEELLAMRKERVLRELIGYKPTAELRDMVDEGITLVERLVKFNPDERSGSAEEALYGLSMGQGLAVPPVTPEPQKSKGFLAWLSRALDY